MMAGLLSSRQNHFLSLLIAFVTLLSRDVFVVAWDPPGWFNGYYFSSMSGGSTSTETISCNKTAQFVPSGTWANCCPTGNNVPPCPMPTLCSSNTVYLDDDSSYTCTSDDVCATMTVYESSPSASPSSTQVFCWKDWEASTVYRQLPAETSASTTTSSSSETGGPSNADDNNGASQTGSEDNQGSSSTKSSGSKAWIAGAVIGPVAAICIALLIFWYLRRKLALKEKEASEKSPSVTAPPPGPDSSSAYEYGSAYGQHSVTGTLPKYSGPPTITDPSTPISPQSIQTQPFSPQSAPRELDHPQRLNPVHELP